MKKAFRNALLPLMMLILSISGCSKKSIQNDSSIEPNHVHTFALEWANDEHYHWHPATCGHDEKSDYQPHVFYQDECICGYRRTSTINGEKDLSTGKVGYTYQFLGNCQRKIPTEIKDEGMVTQVQTVDGVEQAIEGTKGGYPTYGRNIGYTTLQKNQNIDECNLLNTQGGTYNRLDKNGNLYKDNAQVLDSNNNARKLYKHSASTSMYRGQVSDEEAGVIKKVTFQPKSSKGYNITGLYAPAGEVIDIEFDKEDFDRLKKVGSIEVRIGQSLNNGQENNIWPARNFNRMAVILNKFTLNENTLWKEDGKEIWHGYVGSFFGGPIHVVTASSTISMKIIGAVNYRYFIYGMTSREEFEQVSKSTAPYFDLEVWENGVVMGGPVSNVKNLNYDDLYNAATLWDKISLVSNKMKFQGSIVFIFDCFVAAGAAVAFPGRRSVNCPDGWMSSALNYNQMVTSGGWGNIHEYNHNFQGYGCPGGGEVTNNALNIVAYTAFTNISQCRTMNNSGEAGYSDWNAYTSASWVLRSLKSKTTEDQNANLQVYSTLIHNIGQKAFIEGSTNASGVDNYMKALSNRNKLDMTYFFKNIAKVAPSDAAVNEIKEKNYEKFIPVGCVYQTGRSININERKIYTDTVRPFVIPYNQDYTLDLSEYRFEDNFYAGGSITLPEGFTYKIKNISQPEYGKIENGSKEKTYIYKPDKEHLQSGKIYVTLQLSGPIQVNDIQLVIDLKQSKELTKFKLTNTTYKYQAEEGQTNEKFASMSARQAYESNFAGHSEKDVNDNYKNPNKPNSNVICQDCNSEIWLPSPTNNAFMQLEGKILINSDGDYKLALRGRHSTAVFVSVNDKSNYQFAAEANYKDNKNSFDISEGSTAFKEYTNLKGGTWLYYKLILKVDYASAFVGLGLSKRSEGTQVVSDKNPGEVGYFEPYIDESTRTYPKPSYVTSYNNDYELPDNSRFKSDYIYERSYSTSYSYSNESTAEVLEPIGKLVSGGLPSQKGFEIEHLFDNDDETRYCSVKNPQVSEENPFDILVDLQQQITANKLILNLGQNQCYPKTFKLYVGNDQENLTQVIDAKDIKQYRNSGQFTFPTSTFRYYRLYITKSIFPAQNLSVVELKSIRFKYVDQINVTDNDTHTGKLLKLQNSIFTKKGNWSIDHKPSVFGERYNGVNSSTIEFSAKIDRFAIKLSSFNSINDIDVLVDNKKMNMINKNSDGSYTYPLLSEEIINPNKKDIKVKITLKTNLSVEAISLWYLN